VNVTERTVTPPPAPATRVTAPWVVLAFFTVSELSVKPSSPAPWSTASPTPVPSRPAPGVPVSVKAAFSGSLNLPSASPEFDFVHICVSVTVSPAFACSSAFCSCSQLTVALAALADAGRPNTASARSTASALLRMPTVMVPQSMARITSHPTPVDWPPHAGELLAVGEPVRHQIEELPVISTRLIEHRCPRVRCPGCGEQARAMLPADLAARAFGPRFQAAVAALSVRNRISRCDVVELAEELFGARLCAGTVEAILGRVARALKDPYEDLAERVRASESLNMDETGWRTAGEAPSAVGNVHRPPRPLSPRPRSARRSREESARRYRGDRHLRPLVGLLPHAFGAPPALLVAPAARFSSHTEGLAARRSSARQALRCASASSGAWEVFAHTKDRRELKRTIRSLQRTYEPIIRSFATRRARNRRCRGMARNLLKLWPALWTFASHTGARSSTASSHSAANPRVANNASSACSRRRSPAAFSGARCSSTSPTRSAPTPAAIRCRCSPEREGTERLPFLHFWAT